MTLPHIAHPRHRKIAGNARPLARAAWPKKGRAWPRYRPRSDWLTYAEERIVETPPQAVLLRPPAEMRDRSIAPHDESSLPG